MNVTTTKNVKQISEFHFNKNASIETCTSSVLGTAGNFTLSHIVVVLDYTKEILDSQRQ